MARYEFENIEDFALKARANGELNKGKYPNIAIKSGVAASGDKFVGYVLLTAVGVSFLGKEEPYVYQELSDPLPQEDAQKEADDLAAGARDFLQEKAPLCELIAGTVTAEWKKE